MADLQTAHRVRFVYAGVAQTHGATERELLPREARHLRAVEVADAWIEEPIGDRKWTAAGRLSFQNGRWLLSEIRVFPTEQNADREPGTWSGGLLGVRATTPGRGITARELRRVPIGALVRKGEQMIEVLHRMQAGFPFGAAFQRPANVRLETRRVATDGADLAVDTRRQRGRRAQPDIVFARYARDYVEAKTGAKPIIEVARKHGITVAAARSAIHTARRRKMLSDGTPGRVGGLLTDRAKELLAAADVVGAKPRRGHSARIRQRSR